MLAIIGLILFQVHSAESGLQPKIVRYFRSETAKDMSIDRAVHEYLGDSSPDSFDISRYAFYLYNKVDLNGDGVPEVLVYLASDCGSKGCDLLVMQKKGKKYEVISVIDAAWTPIVVGNRRTNGWHDLVPWYRGYGGNQPSFYTVMKFDGKNYVTDFRPLNESEEGNAYLDSPAKSEFGVALNEKGSLSKGRTVTGSK